MRSSLARNASVCICASPAYVEPSLLARLCMFVEIERVKVHVHTMHMSLLQRETNGKSHVPFGLTQIEKEITLTALLARSMRGVVRTKYEPPTCSIDSVFVFGVTPTM